MGQLEVERLDVGQFLVELLQVGRGDFARWKPGNYQGYVGRHPGHGDRVVLVTPPADYRIGGRHRDQDRALRSTAAGPRANHGLQR
jgi:hypothetical protein